MVKQQSIQTQYVLMQQVNNTLLPIHLHQLINGQLQVVVEHLQTGQGSNSITVDWGAVSGLYPNAVEVIESNAAKDVLETPVLIDVYVLDLSGNAIGPFCPGDPSTTLVGNPAGGTWSGTGVVGNDFDPATAGVGNYVLTYSMAGCNTTINVIVNSGPVTGPIQHY